MTRFGRETWSVVVHEGWRVWHDSDCAVLIPVRGVGALQVSVAFKQSQVVDADLLDFARDQVHSGVSLTPVRLGEFTGFEFAVESEQGWWKYWYLRNHRQMLFVTYNCSVVDRGVDDAAIMEVLSTLSAS